jgi:hypothetical protein
MEQIGFNKSISRLKRKEIFHLDRQCLSSLEENHVVDVSPHCRCQETRRDVDVAVLLFLITMADTGT